MQREQSALLGPLDGDTYYEAPLPEMQRLYARYKVLISSDHKSKEPT
jgi:hypothetical protein